MYAGTGSFDDYGDRIRACDRHCSPWKTGNIAEGTPITIRVCLVNGDFEATCGEDDGVA